MWRGWLAVTFPSICFIINIGVDVLQGGKRWRLYAKECMVLLISVSIMFYQERRCPMENFSWKPLKLTDMVYVQCVIAFLKQERIPGRSSNILPLDVDPDSFQQEQEVGSGMMLTGDGQEQEMGRSSRWEEQKAGRSRVLIEVGGGRE